jgi:HlyD family secretion protein
MLALFSRHKVWALLLLLVAGLAVWIGARRLRGVEVEAVQLRPQPFVQTVVATGRVMSPARVAIGAVITGRVVNVLVQEGDAVKTGQPLIQLETEELEAALKQAQAAEQTARTRVASVGELGLATAQESLAQAKASLEWYEREVKRQRELHASGFIGEAKLEEAERAYRVARSQYDAARTQASSQTKGGVQTREAVARLQEAIAARELAAAKLGQATIRASVPGTILTRAVEPGDIVQANKTLLTLAGAGETRISAQIDEKNLPYMKVGDAALASADAFPEAKFKAELYYVAPSVDAQRGAVEARFRVPQPPAHLRADMTLSVEVLGARKENALVVPSRALRTTASSGDSSVHGNGGLSVLVVESGKAAARNVTLGLRGDGHAEIAQGLRAGEQVILKSDVAPGARVRAKLVDAQRIAERAPN